MPAKKLRAYLFSLLIGFSIITMLTQTAVALQSAKADAIPWSGYWWPMNDGGLSTGIGYRGTPSPLMKYELLHKGFFSGELLSWYNDRNYKPDGPPWWGLCASWAQASVFEHYEFFPSSENNIIFRVGDKKGLVTLVHDTDLFERGYGENPEVFHYWLLHYIGDEKKAFVADLDAGEEVWSYPIYQYEMESVREGNIESVDVLIYYADDFVDPDYMGTKIRKESYTYDLFLDEDNNITHGEWTGRSMAIHPERLTMPLEVNLDVPFFDYQEVMNLAASKDDELENGADSVALSPGTYNLVLMDEDRYRIDCLSGDSFQVFIEKEPGNFQKLGITISDGAGELLVDTEIDKYDPFQQTFTAQTPPYSIGITQSDYTDPTIYAIKLDVKKQFVQKAPYIPTNIMWSGFVVTNPKSVPIEQVTVTAYDEDGNPLQTLLGPLTLAAGEKRQFMFDDLPYRLHELVDIDSLKIMADDELAFLHIMGRDNLSPQAVFSAKGVFKKRLILPDAISSMDFNRRMFGGFANESFVKSNINIRIFNRNGTIFDEITSTLNPGQTYGITPSSMSRDLPNDGWIEITGDRVLSGFQTIRSTGTLETMYDLPIKAGMQYIPFAPPSNGYWNARLTIVNPNQTDNHVRFASMYRTGESISEFQLAPNEKKQIPFDDAFGFREEVQSAITLDGKLPFAGYYSFQGKQGGDDVRLPFLDANDFSSELILPHYAGKGGYYWTAVCLFNPLNEMEIDIVMEPYGEDGLLIENEVRSLHLSSGSNERFGISSIFGESANSISFIRFRVNTPGGLIGGYYLFGNIINSVQATDSLCGGVM